MDGRTRPIALPFSLTRVVSMLEMEHYKLDQLLTTMEEQEIALPHLMDDLIF